MRTLSLFLTVSAFLLPPQTQSYAEYRLSESFELSSSIPAAPAAYLPLSDGRAIANGSFSTLDGELVGSLVIIETNGAFSALATDTPLLNVKAEQAVLNNDQSISILVSEHNLPDLPNSPLALLVVSPNRETKRIVGVPWGITLLPDLKFIAVENKTNYDNPPETRWTCSATRYQLTDQNTLEPDGSFQTPNLRGAASSITPAPDGTYFLAGDFPNPTTLATDHLIKLAANGSRAEAFDSSKTNETALGFTSFSVHPLPTGELYLVPQYASTGIQLARMLPDGRIDSSFILAPEVSLFETVHISPAANGKLYLTSPFLQIGQAPTHAIRLNNDGSRDEAFLYNRNQYYEELDYGHSAFPLPDGTLFTSGRIDREDYRSIDFAIAANDGALAPASPGVLEQLTEPRASWLPSGELLLNDGIAAIDGSRRRTFADFTLNYKTPLTYGGFIGDDFKRYDADGRYIETLPIRPYSNLISPLPDGSFLIFLSEDKGQNWRTAKLLPNGGIDPDFPDLPNLHRIHKVTDTEIYYIESVADQETLRRCSLETGQIDPDFAIQTEIILSQPITVTDSALYIPYTYHFGGWRDSPFGARFTFDGVKDDSFQPEQYIRQAPYADWPSSSNFAPDGTGFHLAIGRDEDDQEQRLRLWRVSPTGEPSLVDASQRWTDGHVAVSRNGEVLVVGTAQTQLGDVETALLYIEKPIALSTPFRRELAPSQGSINLQVKVLEGDGAVFSWTKNGQLIPDANSPTLELEGDATDLAGDYLLSAKMGSETFRFGPISLLLPEPPTITKHPTGATQPFGYNTSLEGFAIGRPIPELQWFRDGQALSGANENSLELGALALADLGTYQLRAKSSSGSTWSQPAVLTVAGPVQVGTLSYGVQKQRPKNITRLVPRKDGGFFLEYQAGAFAYSFSQYESRLPDQTVIPDLAEHLDVPGYDYIGICPFTGTRFAYWQEFENGGLGTYTRFTRLLDDGSVDTAFGDHNIIGDIYELVRFRQFPDGTVWAEARPNAIEISPSGEETALVLDRENWDLRNSSFVHRFSLRLEDGSFALGNANDENVSPMLADGTFDSARDRLLWNYRSDGIKHLGIWPNGTVLFHDAASNTLIAKEWNDPILWSIDLGDLQLVYPDREIPANLPLSVPSPDNVRIHIPAYTNSQSSEARVLWVESDGTTNLDSATPFTLDFHPTHIASLDGQRFVFARSNFGLDLDASPALTIDLSSGETTAYPLSTFEDRIIQSLSNAAADGSYFASLNGDIIDGQKLGSLVRFTPDRAIDPTFVAEALPGLESTPRGIEPFSNGKAALLSQINSSLYYLNVFDSDGAGLASIALDNLSQAPKFDIQTDSHLIVFMRTDSERKVIRYAIDGTLDPDFEITLPQERDNLRNLRVDPQGRIYLSFSNSNFTSYSVFRYHSNGTLDPSFTFDTRLPYPKNIEFDSDGRLMVAAEKLYRLADSGSIDPQFIPTEMPDSSIQFFHALLDGSFLAYPNIYDEEGRLIKQISTPALHTGFDSHYLVGATILSVPAFYSELQDIAVFNISSFPSISFQPRSQSAAQGRAHSLTVVAEGAPFLSYRWSKDGQVIADATGPTLSFDSVESTDYGTYQVTLIWDDGQLELPAFTFAEGQASPLVGPAPTLSCKIVNEFLEVSWPTNADYRLTFSRDLQAWIPSSYSKTVYEEDTTVKIPLELSHDFRFLRLEPEI